MQPDPRQLRRGAMYAFVSPLDPLGGYNVYTCQGSRTPSRTTARTATRICIPELDDAWNAVKNSVDFAVVRDAMGKVQDLYSKSADRVPLFYWKNAYLVSPKLHNVIGNPTTSPACSGTWRTGGSTSNRLLRPLVTSQANVQRGRLASLHVSSRLLGSGRWTMGRFIIRRVIQAIPVLFGSLVRHLRASCSPPRAGRGEVRHNPRITQEQIEAFRQRWGLDQPIPIQYCRWMGVCNPDGEGLGDLHSATTGVAELPAELPRRRRQRHPPRRLRLLDQVTAEKVTDGIGERLVPTFILAGTALVIWLTIAIVSASTPPSTATRCSTTPRRSSPTSGSRCRRSGWASC